MWKNRECGKQILRACEGTGRAEKAGESGKKYGLLQLYMGILLLLVVSVSGNVPYSGVNREKISLYGSRAEQGDKKEDPAAVQSAVKPEPLNLNSRSAVLMDADTGRVLYGKNETEDLPMASTTKIMTCILALENAGGDGGPCLRPGCIDAGGKASHKKGREIPDGRSPVFADAGIP